MLRISFLFLIIISACNDVNETKEPGKKQKIQLTQLQLTDLHDQPIDPKRFKGKTIFINFWATWCKPCKEEMPSIREAMKLLKEEKIEFLFASDETTEEIERFKAAHPYNFFYVKIENLGALGIMGLPTTFIFEPNGELVFSEMGYRKWDNEANMNIIRNNAERK